MYDQGTRCVYELPSRRSWCFGVRQRESATMAPYGRVKGKNFKKNKRKKKKKRKMVFASFYKAEGERGGCHPPAEA